MITTIRCSIFACLLLSACGSDQSPDAGKKVVSLDLLGIMHEDFPCEKYIKEMEDATEINLGYLTGGTFGESRECLERIVSDPRTRSVRLHTCSGPCVSNSRCHSKECFYGLQWRDSDQLLRNLREFAGREFSLLDSTRVYFVSPILEHQLDRETFDRAAELLLRLAAEYGLQIEIIDNPVYPHESKYLLEVHGQYETTQRPYLYSLDGYFGIGEFFLAMNDEALVSFKWTPAMNGLCTDGSPWVSPLERKCF